MINASNLDEIIEAVLSADRKREPKVFIKNLEIWLNAVVATRPMMEELSGEEVSRDITAAGFAMVATVMGNSKLSNMEKIDLIMTICNVCTGVLVESYKEKTNG